MTILIIVIAIIMMNMFNQQEPVVRPAQREDYKGDGQCRYKLYIIF